MSNYINMMTVISTDNIVERQLEIKQHKKFITQLVKAAEERFKELIAMEANDQSNSFCQK
jgi:hypothetical protein